MRVSRFTRRLVTSFAAVTTAALLATGHATAEAPEVDWKTATRELREVADGSHNPAAARALDLLVKDPRLQRATKDAALPAQPLQMPAESNIGRDGRGPGVYGSGIAFAVDGFRFGFFGGPGTIAPDQSGARLEVIWLNLSTGRSGINQLVEHVDVIADTTIRTPVIDPGPGLVVAAVYGSLWHRWPVAADDAHPDGFAYQKGEITKPAMGAIYN